MDVQVNLSRLCDVVYQKITLSRMRYRILDSCTLFDDPSDPIVTGWGELGAYPVRLRSPATDSGEDDAEMTRL